jgi:hypothetical protein
MVPTSLPAKRLGQLQTGEPEEIAPGRRLFARLGAAFDALAGFLALLLMLAVASAIPFLNLLSLGYLLEGSGRVARSGRFRDGFPGLRGFARVGKAFLAAWLLSLPARLLHSLMLDAELISPGAAEARSLRVALVLYLVLATLHFGWALVRGGRWRHFLWPAPIRFARRLGSEFAGDLGLRRGLDAIRSLRPGHFLRLGALGFAGAALWLALPLLILLGAAEIPRPGPSALASLLGGALLGGAALHLPFLQTRFALTGRFREFLEPKAVRAAFRRAPLAFWFAACAILLLALPPYLLKIELAPSELAWLPNLLFVTLILPARLLLGWAVFRSERREAPRLWLFRWAARLAFIPVVAVYVFIVWISQYLSWHGSMSLLEQHAFLVPAPLFGL